MAVSFWSNRLDYGFAILKESYDKTETFTSTLVHYFDNFFNIILLIYIFQSALAQEETKSGKTEKINFPAAVIDMKMVYQSRQLLQHYKRNSKTRKVIKRNSKWGKFT